MVPAGAGSRAGPRAGARETSLDPADLRVLYRALRVAWLAELVFGEARAGALAVPARAACTAGAAAVPVRPVCGDDRAMAGEHRRRKRPMIALWRLSNSQDLRPGAPPGRWHGPGAPVVVLDASPAAAVFARLAQAEVAHPRALPRHYFLLEVVAPESAVQDSDAPANWLHRPAGHARAGQCLAGARRRDRAAARARRRRAACSTCSMPSTRNWRNARSCRRWPIPTCRI